jgi:hypothetical protein
MRDYVLNSMSVLPIFWLVENRKPGLFMQYIGLVVQAVWNKHDSNSNSSLCWNWLCQRKVILSGASLTLSVWSKRRSWAEAWWCQGWGEKTTPHAQRCSTFFSYIFVFIFAWPLFFWPHFWLTSWAYAITWRPSSVSKARFVTAIDLKLCTYVPLGEMTGQAKFRSDLILGLATRGPKLKTHKVP